ncbi:MAG: NAD-binding protein [Desulfobulbaceae bacterium]|jgi:Trk K+ transport system NAD-binding subunit|nr:NAD-binding protein [Desulfobulbaceae bacterium]
MKFLSSQLIFFLENRQAGRNLRALSKFCLLLLALITAYSLIFHLIMQHEGRDYSIITGFYWTLTVMSTLGFGDITFTGDLGKAFSILVLMTGVIVLLIMLPFTFIQFFYAPWLEAQSKSRVPRKLNAPMDGHVLITNFGPIAMALIERLKQYGHDYLLILPDMQQVLDLVDQGYSVLLGELDNPETWKNASVQTAALVVATNDDMKNTSTVFTVRELAPKVMIVASADMEDSLDILQLAGCQLTFQFMEMLGQSLARRSLGKTSRSTMIGCFEELAIAESPVMRTNLVGRTIKEIALRQKTGLNVVGLWDRGHFTLPKADTRLESSTVLVLAGSQKQLAAYDSFIGERKTTQAPVLILGGGRVGRAAANALRNENVPYRVVEKNPKRPGVNDEHYIIGSAADHDTLVQAGIAKAPSVIITTHSDEVNIYLTIYCRRLRPDTQIISRATLDRNIGVLHSAGADLVMSHASMAASTIINILTPGRLLMLTEGLNIFRYPAPVSLIGKNLLESGIREKAACSVIAIIHQGETRINPDPLEPLQEGEEMLMIGTIEAEKAFTENYLQ